MASKPLVVEARVATELLKADTQTGAALLGNVGDAAEAVADKLEAALGKAGAKFGPWADAANEAISKVRMTSADVAKQIDKLGASLAVSGGDSGAAAARQAADAQKAKLAAIEAVEAATLRMLGTERELTAAERTYVAGLQDAKNKAAAYLIQLNAEAGALERLQIELGEVPGKANEVANAHNRMSTSSQIMMHSIRSGADSFAAGLPPMMIFSEQISRLAEASAYAAQESGKTTGAFATFGRVMGGPWGIAIIAGVSLLGTIIGHMDLFTDKVGEAAKKLQEQAENERVAAQAAIIFGNTLEGLIAREKKLGDELDRQIQSRQQLNRLQVGQAQQQQGEAQGHLNDARTQLSTAQAHYNSAKTDRDTETEPKALAAANVRLANAGAALEAARKVFADSVKAAQDADTNVRKAQVMQLQERAKALVDPKEAVRQRAEAGKDSLTNQYILGLKSPDEYVQGYAAFQKEEDDSKKTKRKGPSEATLAKRAEAARIRAINQDESYTEEERAARHKLLDATSKTAASEEARDAIVQEDINAEAAATKTKIADQLSAKKISAEQAAHLVSLAEQTRLQKLQNVELERRAQDVKDATAQDVAGLDAEIAMAQIRADMATTTKQRRDTELKILDLQEQRERALAQEILANPLSSKADKDSANARLKAVDDLHPAKVQQIERSTASPIDSYKQHLTDTVSDINTSLQSIEVSGLNNLEDAFAGVVTQSESADKAIRSMVTSAIGQLAKLAFQKVAFTFFGLSTGGKIDGKATGGLLGYRNGGIPGYATGTRSVNGMISGPGTGTSDSILAMVNGKQPIMVSDKEGIVNAQAMRNYWPAIDAMNKGTFPRFATGGLLGPSVPSITGMGSRGGIVQQTFLIDAKGAVLANELMAGMQQVSAQHASAALAAAPDLSMQAMARKQNNKIP